MSQKQELTLRLLNHPQIVDLLLGGGAGGAKTLTVGIWMVLECRNFPGIRIGLGRKELSRLKQTSVVTLIKEVHPLLGVKDHEFVYNDQKATITYMNGSMIQLIDLAPQPSDPDFDRFGSMLFTHVVIEEAGEVVRKARDVFISRKNRYKNVKYNIVGKSVSTCNPSQNFLKTDYYKPYKKLGGGGHRVWEYGVVEIKGKMFKAYRAFIKSLASDNPFISRNYIEVLRNLPDAERKRLLEGNWDYEDSDLMLFKPAMIDRSMTRELKTGKKGIGVDVSDAGSDLTILTYVEEGVIVEQKEIKVDKTEAIGDQIALEIIKYAQQHGFTSKEAQMIGIDTLGVGASTRDFMRSKGWYIREFIAGAASTLPIYKNLRGQTIYELSQAMDKGEFKIYEGLQTIETLREQLMAHEYTTEERVILVKSKQKIKEVLGVSPDYAESAYIAYWVVEGDNNPNNDQSRIEF